MMFSVSEMSIVERTKDFLQNWNIPFKYKE